MLINGKPVKGGLSIESPSSRRESMTCNMSTIQNTSTFLGYILQIVSLFLSLICLTKTVCRSVISKLGRKLQFRQRVIATATVFFRRFYLKNSYSETDPFTVIAACCYLAAKAEESPVHIKSVVQESRTIFNRMDHIMFLSTHA